MSRKPREYIMVQADSEEKAEFKASALARGFNAVSVWMKWLAKKDQAAIKRQDKAQNV